MTLPPFPLACRLLACCSVLLLPAVQAQDTTLLWGDTHLHSSYSVDAYSYGNTSADPDTAYRFARGLPVLHPGTGQRVRIDRPLDFLVVADHAEMLQLQYRLKNGDAAWLSKASAERLLGKIGNAPPAVFGEVVRIVSGGGQDLLDDYHRPDMQEITWAKQVETAEAHNDPGTFTAMIGWEWSPGPDGANLHRVVFTPANAETARQFVPLSYYDTDQPEGLWQWLEETSARTGADFVAIPHNSNLSDGRMFDMVDSAGRSLSSEYTRTRLRWEPVMEITQVKGTSETAPELSPEDPFADFEIRNVHLSGSVTPINPGSYARPAMQRGLQQQVVTGTNPFKFGFIGSTDSHTGLSSSVESNHYGKLVMDSLPAQRVTPMHSGFAAWRTSASGMAAVWATENTREAIASAFKRKEVYATTGPRIAVRFFGGFGFDAADADSRDLPATGYNKGVPMGGDLTAAPADKVPGFLVQVDKDPQGANLDRVQMVKGWMDAEGNTHERVSDIVWSGERRPDAKGLVPPLPSTVDLDTASYRNSTGSTQLRTVWYDEDFDPAQAAFYYLRVLEIATPRHQVYDAVALQMDPRDTGYPVIIQERAWSSPIWYTP